MALIPFMFLPFAFAFHLLEDAIGSKERCFLAYLCIGMMGILFLPLAHSWLKGIKARRKPDYSVQLVNYVCNTTAPSEKIIVDGNECWIYNAANRFAVSKFAYRPIPMTEAMMQSFKMDLQNRPALIISRNPDSDILGILPDYRLARQIDEYYIFRPHTEE